MSSMASETAAEAVANGAQLLDEKLPGWWRTIDLETLNLSRCDLCVCGQLTSTMLGFVTGHPLALYEQTLNKLGLKWLDTDADYGFNVPNDLEYGEETAWFLELETEWKQLIVTRLAADALDEQTADRKELIPV